MHECMLYDPIQGQGQGHRASAFPKIASNLQPLRLGEETKKETKKKPQGKHIMVCPIP